jgi:integrase
VRDGLLSANPIRGIARPKDQERKPAFSFEAVEAVGKALLAVEAKAQDDTPGVQEATLTGLRAIKFLLLTGCRRMEALTLQWETVDQQARCLRLKQTKTGAQIRPIGRSVVKILAQMPTCFLAHRKQAIL